MTELQLKVEDLLGLAKSVQQLEAKGRINEITNLTIRKDNSSGIGYTLEVEFRSGDFERTIIECTDHSDW